jgi:hypothetical protein
LLAGGCIGGDAPAPHYALAGGEKGQFQSSNSGSPISLERIKAMSEQEVTATFGAPVLDRRDTATRVFRYQSDGCTLFVFVSNGRAQYADAYDPLLRPLSAVDQCAGSVAAQKRRSA